MVERHPSFLTLNARRSHGVRVSKFINVTRGFTYVSRKNHTTPPQAAIKTIAILLLEPCSVD